MKTQHGDLHPPGQGQGEKTRPHTCSWELKGVAEISPICFTLVIYSPYVDVLFRFR